MLHLNNVKILGKVMNKNSDGQGGMGGGSFGNGGGKSNMLMDLLGNFTGKNRYGGGSMGGGLSLIHI